jgi:hypothetical protein
VCAKLFHFITYFSIELAIKNNKEATKFQESTAEKALCPLSKMNETTEFIGT